MVAWHIVVALIISGAVGFMTCAILTVGKLVDYQRMEGKGNE